MKTGPRSGPSFQPGGRGLRIGKNFGLSGNIRANIGETEREGGDGGREGERGKLAVTVRKNIEHNRK